MKQPQQGRIDIPTTNDGKMRGTAFLNFHIQEEAKAALDKWRFCLELRGRPLRMQYSSDREFKDILQGPMMARFKILIRNLPEEITQEALYEMFSQYGEVIQVHSNCDHYGQHYAIVQYLDVSSVQPAIRNAHRQKVLSHVLLVESYKPNQTYGVLPRNINQLTQPPPQLAAAPAAAAPPAGAANGGGGAAAAAASLPGTTYAALQQQEQRELEEAERQAVAAAAAAAERYPGSCSGGGGGAVGTSNGGAMAAAAAAPDAAASMAVPSFYAAAAAAGSSLAGPTAPGSLAHLGSALRHAQALEEHLCCPITQEPLRDPVVAADGNTYERLAIEAWLQQHDTSPMTNEILPHKALTPNNLIRKIAEEILKGGANTPDNNDAGAAAAAATAPTELMEPPPAAAAAAAALDGAAAAAAVPVPVPVPVPTPAPPPPRPQPHSYQQPQPQQPQLVSTSQSQQPQQPQTYHHHHQHQQQPQQYADYGHHHHHAPPPPPQHQHQQPQVLGGPQLVAAPLTFVHTLQPQQPHFQMQGTTYYTTYRPMGL
ncbi:hypothetical protein PLESTB_000326900 [Pleodorina starrii]|uniref:U-box domain-containing protein n=1 Tax=Pleodorina starrii TaxID=330485 RepID=A0A9W6BE73_9CHLO|nr:hypothetical protein PLESTB_000326900 [Pleodorina starrii]GLC75082.1 hypothetical protein PLESTF_001592000 [Pleodorina starrii]